MTLQTQVGKCTGFSPNCAENRRVFVQQRAILSGSLLIIVCLSLQIICEALVLNTLYILRFGIRRRTSTVPSSVLMLPCIAAFVSILEFSPALQ